MTTEAVNEEAVNEEAVNDTVEINTDKIVLPEDIQQLVVLSITNIRNLHSSIDISIDRYLRNELGLTKRYILQPDLITLLPAEDEDGEESKSEESTTENSSDTTPEVVEE